MSIDPASGFIVPDGMVNRDAPCRGCGYNLRGLSTDGRCPECGTVVGVSVQGDWLRFSDPQFLLTLRKGVRFILWSILITVIVVVLSVILQMAVGPKAAPVIQFAGLLGYIPGIIGAWLLTAPDPSGVGEDRYGTARRIIRIALVIGAVNYVINFGTSAAGPVAPAARLMLQTIAFLAGIVELVGQFAQLNYLSKLALRIPDPQLSKTAVQIMWGLGISYGLILLFAFIAVLLTLGARASAMAGAVIGVGCLVLIVGIIALVYAIMYISMLFKFGRLFEDQAAVARQIWSQHQPPQPPETV
jgi:hypothetical protein